MSAAGGGAGGQGTRLAAGAAWYAGAGWKVFPCWGVVGGRCGCGGAHKEPKDFGKHPQGRLVPSGMKDATGELGAVREWWDADPEANVAVACRESGFLVVDVDPRNGGGEGWERLEELTEGALDETVEAWTGSYAVEGRLIRGRHRFYRVKPGEGAMRDKVEGVRGVDIKYRGYVLIMPSRHASGVEYEWVEGCAPWERQMAWAPEELLVLLRKGGRGAGGSGSGGRAGGGAEDSVFGTLDWAGEKLDVDRLVKEGIPSGERAVTLFKIACAVANEQKAEVLRTERGRQMVRFAVRSINDKACRPPMVWGDGGSDDFAKQCENAIQFVLDNPKETLAMKALSPELVEWVDAQRTGVSWKGAEGGGGGGGGGGLRALPVDPGNLPPDMDEAEGAEDEGVPRRTLTDRGNARRLRDHYRGTVRYTVGMGWLVWNGEYWEPDGEALAVLEKAQVCSTLVVRELVDLEAGSEEAKAVAGWALQSKSTARMRSAIEQWKADSEFTKTPVRVWDSNPELLGVRNGVIDLRTGELLQGTLEMNITKSVPVGYTPGMSSIRWEAFLDFATGGDKEYQGWLQRAAGYTLTGRRDHDVLFMIYGQPGSGKSTFLEALGHVLGKDVYMIAMNTNVLIDDGGKSSSDEYHWAQLRGRRMAVFSEWPEGRRTKEDAIKRLTGDSTITGRDPGGKPFTFESQAKLWVGTNHRPMISDQAMWRRIRAIPFTRVPEVVDPSLKPYLMDPDGGLPAVMSWAVEGAVKLLNASERDGLGWCRAVRDASAEYRRSEDRIATFLEEETKESEGGSVPIKALYYVYRAWVDDRGEKPMTTIAFTRSLEDRGHTVTGNGSRAVVEGRVLLPKIVSDPTSWDELTKYVR